MNKKSKLIVLLLIFVMVFSACSKEAEEKKSDSGKFKAVAIINGTLGDKSFFDSVKRGMDHLEKEMDVEIKIIETGFDESKWEPAIIDASEGGYDVIITGTYQMAQHVDKVAKEFPDQKYIVYDASVEGNNKNVYCMVYKQNEGSFLAGAVAAKLSKSGVLGFVGGMDIPVINDFLYGYIEGAKHVKDDIKVATSYVGNFSDTARAKELAFALNTQGVDIIFPAAAVAGNGALEAVKEKKINAIGVDSDQSLLYSESGDEDMANLIYTSVLKNVDTSIIRAIKLLKEDKLPWGEIESLGIKEDAIGIAKTKYYNENISDEVKKLVDELEAKIKNSEIEVGTAFGKDAKQLDELRNSVKP